MRAGRWLVAMGVLLDCHASGPGSGPAPVAPPDGAPSGGGLLPPCAPGQPAFTALPFALADFQSLTPLGHLAPPPHTFPSDHMYFILRNQGRVPLVSPGDLTVTGVVSSEYMTATPFSDFAVMLRPCRDVELTFGHVKELAPSFMEKLGTPDPSFCMTYLSGGTSIRYCARQTAFTVAAGEAIGVAGGDFGVKDGRVPALDYVDKANNPASPDGIDTLHVVCPVDYFRDDLKALLRGRIGDVTGDLPRMTEPWCGAVMQDVRGSARGRWFAVGAMLPGQDDPNLALVDDNDWNTTRRVFSVGSSAGSAGLTSGVYFFHPSASGEVNRDFASVTDGSVHCYQDFSGVVSHGVEEKRAPPLIILIQLVDANTLRIEGRQEDSCSASSAFTDRALTFRR